MQNMKLMQKSGFTRYIKKKKEKEKPREISCFDKTLCPNLSKIKIESKGKQKPKSMNTH